MEFTVERHRRQLARIVAALFGMIGLAEGASVERLALPVYRRVLRVLQPAESAVRRLIVVLAHGLALAPPRARCRAKTARAIRKSRSSLAFRLFDPRRRFASAFADERPRFRRRISVAPRPGPRIRLLDFDPRVPLFRQALSVAAEAPPTLPEEDTVSAAHLCRRLAALKSALEDLPRQAKRYARWQARPVASRRPDVPSALRPGPPPGHRKRPIHEVDEILAACDWLARHPPEPDTS